MGMNRVEIPRGEKNFLEWAKKADGFQETYQNGRFIVDAYSVAALLRNIPQMGDKTDILLGGVTYLVGARQQTRIDNYIYKDLQQFMDFLEFLKGIDQLSTSPISSLLYWCHLYDVLLSEKLGLPIRQLYTPKPQAVESL